MNPTVQHALRDVKQQGRHQLINPMTHQRIEEQARRDRKKTEDWHTYKFGVAVAAAALVVFGLGFAACFILIGL